MLIVSNCYASIADTKTVVNVLVVNSYHIGHKWEQGVLKGLISADEQDENYDLKISMEYLDIKNGGDEVYSKRFREMLETKYPKGSIDVIYTVDDEAYAEISPCITNEESAFYQMPLVFSGVDKGPELSE